MEIQDRRVPVSYTFPARLHEYLDQLAKQRFDGNRTAATEHIIMLGLEVYRAQKPPPPELSVKT